MLVTISGFSFTCRKTKALLHSNLYCQPTLVQVSQLQYHHHRFSINFSINFRHLCIDFPGVSFPSSGYFGRHATSPNFCAKECWVTEIRHHVGHATILTILWEGVLRDIWHLEFRLSKTKLVKKAWLLRKNDLASRVSPKKNVLSILTEIQVSSSVA